MSVTVTHAVDHNHQACVEIAGGGTLRSKTNPKIVRDYRCIEAGAVK